MKLLIFFFISLCTRLFLVDKAWKEKNIFNRYTDTIMEQELIPGFKTKLLDIKPSEKTTWEFEDGRVIEYLKKPKNVG